MPRPGAKPSATLLAGAGLVIGAALAYRNAFSGPFVYDDRGAVTENPTLAHLSSALFPPAGGFTVSGRPILNLSFAINHALGGLDPWGYHAVNLAIHVLAGLALFGIVRRTRGFSLAAAFAVALLWLVHPLQTESVTYVAQRAESLMGLFYLATLYCFVRFTGGESYAGVLRGRTRTEAMMGKSRTGPPSCVPLGGTSEGLPDEAPPCGAEEVGQKVHRCRAWWGWFSIGACLLGMLTKEVMVSAPIIVFLYDRTFVAGSFADAWRLRRRYYLALASTWVVLIGLVSLSGARGGSAGFNTGVPWQLYLLTQFSAIVRYLGLAIWPHPLVFDYGRELARSAAEVFPAIVVVLGLAAGTAWSLVRRPAVGFAGFAFFAILAPSSSIVPVATETIAEHRMYLALAPVLALAVGAAAALAGRIRDERVRYRAEWIALAVAALALILLTGRRNEVYRSEEALWRDTIQRRPDNALAHYDLGVRYLKTGDTAAARSEFEEAIRLAPDYADAYINRGNLLQKEGRNDEAIADFQKAISFKPGSAEAHNDLGIALATAGSPDRAVAEFGEAVRIRPDFADAHGNLGSALASSGQVAAGLAELEEAVRLDPRSVRSRTNLGLVLRALGREEEGRAQLERAAQLQAGGDDAAR